MKRFYKPLGNLKYQMCQPAAGSNFYEHRHALFEEKNYERLKEIKMELISEDMGEELKRSDSPWLGSYALIFTSKALSIMNEYVYKYGDAVPLNIESGDFFLWVVTNIKDALVEDKSDIYYSGEKGRIGFINTYKLDESVLGGDDVFKLANDTYGNTFVSENFVSDWKKAKLKGLDFDPIPLA